MAMFPTDAHARHKAIAHTRRSTCLWKHVGVFVPLFRIAHGWNEGWGWEVITHGKSSEPLRPLPRGSGSLSTARTQAREEG